jgi:hypothetical protein
MLYEPPKTKKYILIGAAAIMLVVLVALVFSLIFRKSKTTKTPADDTAIQEKMMQEKIKDELNKLDKIKKGVDSALQEPAAKDIQTEQKKLEEAKPQPKSNVAPPTKEDIQKQLDLLNAAK